MYVLLNYENCTKLEGTYCEYYTLNRIRCYIQLNKELMHKTLSLKMAVTNLIRTDMICVKCNKRLRAN